MIHDKMYNQLLPMVINWRQIEAQVDWIEAFFHQLIISSLMNVTLRLNLMVIRKTINFVDEYFKPNIRIDFVRARHSEI